MAPPSRSSPDCVGIVLRDATESNAPLQVRAAQMDAHNQGIDADGPIAEPELAARRAQDHAAHADGAVANATESRTETSRGEQSAWTTSALPTTSARPTMPRQPLARPEEHNQATGAAGPAAEPGLNARRTQGHGEQDEGAVSKDTESLTGTGQGIRCTSASSAQPTPTPPRRRRRGARAYAALLNLHRASHGHHDSGMSGPHGPMNPSTPHPHTSKVGQMLPTRLPTQRRCWSSLRTQKPAATRRRRQRPPARRPVTNDVTERQRARD